MKIDIFIFKKRQSKGLAGVVQWLEHQPANKRVPGSIPSQGTCLGWGPGPQLGACKRQPHIDISLPPCPQSAPSAVDENKSTKTRSAWGGKVANLSKEKDQEPFPQWAFIGFILHRNTGKAHQSLSGSKDQTIDNIQRTLRAYKEFWVRVS